MDSVQAKKAAQALMEQAPAAIVSTLDHRSAPQTRAMLNLCNVDSYPGLIKFRQGYTDDFFALFTTNTSSNKVKQIQAHPLVSVYYTLPEQWRGLMLGGTMEIVTDQAVKRQVWQQGWELYYAKGPEDPDYAVLFLKPGRVRYYHQLQQFDFSREG